MTRHGAVLLGRALCAMVLVTTTACATARPPAAPPAAPALPDVSIDQKLAWLLRLEQQRALRDSGAAAVPASVRTLAPARTPDLEALARDPESGVRRRAILAIGRVGLTEGLPALSAALADPKEAENVRATAAFAIGLLGSKDGIGSLLLALKDPSAAIRGRAMEALGLIGDPSAAGAVADAASGCAPLLAPLVGDDEPPTMTPDLEACRLALFALVRLRQYDALARVALDAQGQPVSRWWPVAYALQRIGDARAAAPLAALLSAPGVYTPAFALRGLAAAKDARAVEPALALVGDARADIRLRVAAIRALGAVGGAAAAPPLVKLLDSLSTPRNLQIEAVAALSTVGDQSVFDVMLELFADPWPALRAAAMTTAAKINPDGFLLVISNSERDREWSVRANLATVLGTLRPEQARTALHDLVTDSDVRVRGPALEALAKVGGADLAQQLFDALDTPDFVVRATAARLIGEQKIQGGADRLVAAYQRGESDVTYVARAAALEALATYGPAMAVPTLRRALSDREWPVRIRAAELLHELGDTAMTPARPAPLRQPVEFFQSEALIRPKFSPRAFVETRRGTIEIELNVVDAPVTSQTFVELARAGFFNGLKVHRVVPNFVVQAGDPRGDGEAGPGFTLRDELSPLPFRRGTVGMALAWRDTAGSQFFITVSPQPHLDAKYTVFGQVVNGFEFLDQIALGDVIERIRIWDGVTLR